jgi:oxygen-independent coproporphyrinogen-3 oxidase
MSQQVRFERSLIERYDIAGPRYTSYPTALQFHEGFDEQAYRLHAHQSNEELIPRPLSIYVHLPFCDSLCYYCGCNKKITRHADHGIRYLKLLEREIQLQAGLYDNDRVVSQLHFGGGTPTFFDDDQLEKLMGQLASLFPFADPSEREFSIEVDPRTVSKARLERLLEMGFDRISLGVQDMDPKVQQAVNRIQDRKDTLDLISEAQNLGFNSVSVDLIYGLPLQKVETFQKTLDDIVNARPDRLAVYNYAHMPHIFRPQRLIRSEDIPSPETKLTLMQLCIEDLTQRGYVYIGMDHFALPDDELTKAQVAGDLQRNFQGYSTMKGSDLVALGVSAIGAVGDCYVQNYKDIPAWEEALTDNRLPVWRGLTLTTEDRLRRMVIGEIMCHGKLDFRQIERRFNIDFSDHFAAELESLDQLEADGLLILSANGLEVTDTGRLLLRAIAMAFDEYLQVETPQVRFSRVI